MPFEIDNTIFEDVIKTINDYYSSIKPFDTYIQGLEKDTCIIWLRMINNEFIDKICYDINHILMEKYNIGLHEYDLDYKFHTTLFIDDDIEKIDKAFDLIKDTNTPTKLLVNRFVIGTSETGDFGTYFIYKTIEL